MCRFHSTEFDLLPERAFRPVGRRMTLEGGKGSSSAPPPDPRLVEAQLKSMGIQDDAIQRILANSESMLPLQQEQIRFGLDSARTAFDQSREDRGYALARRGVLTSMQDQLVGDAKSFNTEARREQLSGEAAADVSQAFATARDTTGRQMARIGINPGGAKFAGVFGRMATDEAIAKATAMNKASTAARGEGYALTDRATNALAGYPAMGERTTGAGAQFGTSGLTVANTGLAGMNAGPGSAAQIAGNMGANASGMYGQQAGYKNAQDRIAQDDGGFMGLVGTIAGAGIKAYSDRRLKRRVRKLCDDPRGFAWYEFDYVWGGPRQVGVMADEVASMIPEAVGSAGGFQTVDYAML